MSLGVLALVGAPSAGKSTIFNRIVGERKSIVEPTPGVTRDRIYGKGVWLTKEFTVIDTGGLTSFNVPFQDLIKAQAEVAIQEADIIAFIVDGNKGLTSDDRYIAKMLRMSGKPVVLVVNKIDNIMEYGNTGEFYSLGLGDPIAVSGAHGIGIGDLLDEVVKKLPEKEVPDYGDAITFCLIGRPNVGKSSLSNRLLVVIDTAGLVKRGKIFEAIDKYAALRALASIERSEIVLLLINAEEGIIEQDKHVVGYACDNHKAIIVVVNKWDEGKKKGLTKEEFTKEIRKQFKFLEYAPILFTSAKSGLGCQDILPKILEVHEAYNRRIPTNVLNEIIRDAQDLNPAPEFNHARLKISFANQSAVCPPTFIMFCNAPKSAHFSYTRYLENQIRAAYDFDGTPVNIIYRAKK